MRLVWLALGMLGLPPRRSVPLAMVAACGDAVLPAGADPSGMLCGVASLDRAGRGDVSASFDDLPGDLAHDDLRATRAGVCFVPAHRLPAVPEGTIALVTATPRLALRRVATLIYGASLHGASGLESPAEAGGIDPSALVHRDARLEPHVTVAAGAIVGPRAEIGSGTRIGAHATIDADVRVGRDGLVEAQASLSAALLGDRVVVRAGARVGAVDPDGGPSAAVGRVILQDDVEIGANAVVARGDLEDTVIGEGSRVDALAFVPPGALVARHAVVDRAAPGPGRPPSEPVSSSPKMV